MWSWKQHYREEDRDFFDFVYKFVSRKQPVVWKSEVKSYHGIASALYVVKTTFGVWFQQWLWRFFNVRLEISRFFYNFIQIIGWSAWKFVVAILMKVSSMNGVSIDQGLIKRGCLKKLYDGFLCNQPDLIEEGMKFYHGNYLIYLVVWV